MEFVSYGTKVECDILLTMKKACRGGIRFTINTWGMLEHIVYELRMSDFLLPVWCRPVSATMKMWDQNLKEENIKHFMPGESCLITICFRVMKCEHHSFLSLQLKANSDNFLENCSL